VRTLEMAPADSGRTDGGDPYVAYSYAYPHKSAYGPLEPPVLLESLWRGERRDALFLYVHLPFCEMRCGFCNLFTRAHADHDLVEAYLGQLEQQTQTVADLLGDFAVARFAVGGGTPTYLTPRQLERLFDMVQRHLGVTAARLPTSVETSPKTATAERLAVLRARGVRRVSIGVQSFDEAEAHAMGRPQAAGEVHTALERLRSFAVLNIDLIYGHPAQTVASVLRSVHAALQYQPAELFLYPLYVRAETGLGRQGLKRCEAGHTLGQYRAARDLLCAAGYEQISMRCFRAAGAATAEGPAYCCQRDGMIGLGCGARSYTHAIHYASRFAVEAVSVQRLIEDWLAQPPEALRYASWGLRLSEDERRRRFVIQSLLQRNGLSRDAFQQTFGLPVEVCFPELVRWEEQEFLTLIDGSWTATRRGLEYSDYLGPALYSAACRAALEAFVGQ
jgi:coproporphyrinogen III oxidase-like Fe-S oxidoreductase